MLTLPTLILPSISLSGAYLLAWLDPWPIWLLKFFTSAATLTPLIGGRSVFVHMNFFLAADPSEAARILKALLRCPKHFQRPVAISRERRRRNVVLRELTSLVQCVFPYYLHLHFIRALSSAASGEDPFKRIPCSPQGDSLDEIQRHPWFSSLDWAALDRKELSSPFVPDVGLLR